MGHVAVVYKRLPAWQVFVLSVIVGGGTLAFVIGIAGGIAGIYLYDRGSNKGNDLAVGPIALHAVSTFVFVIVFLGTQTAQRNFWRTPLFTCCAVSPRQ